MKLTRLVQLLPFVLVPVFIFAGILSSSEVSANDEHGAVYVLSNATTGNAVLVFHRSANGSLTAAGSVPTGGMGNGATGGLGSQGALIMSKDGRWLFAVNAGSNSISVLEAGEHGLRLVDTMASGGISPISVSVYKQFLYVLNAGDATHAANISGFTVSPHGMLSPLAGSTRPLSTAQPGPGQVQFSSDGNALVVTEKATSKIDVYAVDKHGIAGAPVVYASHGTTPFGFAFDQKGHLFVSEATGAAPNSAVSSYSLRHDDILTLVSGSVPTTQAAACWEVVTRNGKYTYATNAGSATITGFSIGHDGSLTRLNSNGVTASVTPGSHPSDTALSKNSRFLYTLANGTHTIYGFQVHADGSLSPVSGASGLPATAAGIIAR